MKTDITSSHPIHTHRGSKLVEAHLPCPLCSSSDAYALYDDGHGYCFSCSGYSGLKREFILSDFSYEYLPRRGITRETYAFYDAKTKIDGNGEPVAIGYAYCNGSYKIRNLLEKGFHSQGEINKAGLYGKDKFSAGSARYVIITEGEEDAHSYYQVLKYPTVSVQSSSSAGRDCALDRAWLNAFDTIYLALDNDEPGRLACDEVARLFDYNKVKHIKFSKYKDANAYLEAGETDELKRLFWNARKYQPERIVASMEEFKTILAEKPVDGWPYPFPQLTEMTYGIRTGESVLITAQEGVGKTEIMHAIEHKLLKEFPDVNVGAIYLEEPKRRHLQSLAGIELQKPVHLPDTPCTDGEVSGALAKVLHSDVRDERLFLYSHFGSDDPDVLLDVVRFLASARSCSVILLDHITMCVSGLSGEDERRALDYLSTRLEMMVKELNFALILVSHVNDDGRTRGSRYISKIADIRIDATRDLVHPDLRVRNTVKLTVAKNRFSGRTGPAGEYEFVPELQLYRGTEVWPATTTDTYIVPKVESTSSIKSTDGMSHTPVQFH
jgi:twinkle protein